MSPTIAVLTVSDSVSNGSAVDATGPAVIDALAMPVAETLVVPDEQHQIEAALIRLCDAGFEIVLTNGGTGLGPRDVTPEATNSVVDRVVPGMAEVMRSTGRASTPLASLSRQVVGVRAATLIVNLPGSPRGAVESLEAIKDLLPHAIAMLRGGNHGSRPLPPG